MKLNYGQELAMEDLQGFLLNDEKSRYLAGGAGTGKTTLVRFLLEEVPKINPVCELAGQSMYEAIRVAAPTNKAVSVIEDSFSNLYLNTFAPSALTGNLEKVRGGIDFQLGQHVGTLHRIFGVRYDAFTQTSFWDNPSTKFNTRTLFIIDEASMCDDAMLDCIYKFAVQGSKILFLLDEYQLPPVSGKQYADALGNPVMPLFMRNITGNRLTEIMRQKKEPGVVKGVPEYIDLIRQSLIDGTPVSKELLTDFEGVYTIDSRAEFEHVINHFTDATNQDLHMGILAYTNKRVTDYWRAIRGIDPRLVNFIRGGTAYAANGAKVVIKEILRDQTATINGITLKYNVVITSENQSYVYDLPATTKAYIRDNFKTQKDGVKELTGLPLSNLTRSPIMTIHKSQGSTFDNVLIDLDSIYEAAHSNTSEFLRRLLYVGASRTRKNIILVGSYPEKIFKE